MIIVVKCTTSNAQSQRRIGVHRVSLAARLDVLAAGFRAVLQEPFTRLCVKIARFRFPIASADFLKAVTLQ